MSNPLTVLQASAGLSTAPGTPALDLDEIQGDVLLGLQKFFERFLFFEIADASAFKAALGTRLARRVTSTTTVQLREAQLQDLANQGSADVLPNIGLNLGFTQSGIQKLVAGANLNDTSFAAGAAAQAGALGDPINGQVPANWLAAFAAGNIDGVFLITGGTQDAINCEAYEVLAILGAAVSVVYDETGSVRPGSGKGHEHFGWQDGISQPGISGLTTALPGQRLLDPGRFVLGYPGQPSGTTAPPIPWMSNGSFMVFRRLVQLVPEFEQFLLDQAGRLGVDPVLLGARLMGRWKSGAPLALTPSQDDTTLGHDPLRNNNFDFSDDQAQRRCPFGAHIRKTNPRQDLAPQESSVDPRRIIRAGIPFGPEVSPDEQASGKTQQQRGLMFVCYQASIASQFEFLQATWANNPGFVFGKTHPDGTPVAVGWDPIIGQNSAPGQNRVRTMDEPVSNYSSGGVRSTLQAPQDFVIATGGAYFFMPAISALKNELST
ncbi:MAG TPA: Dyp-type peroxidase [Terriglobia bacterium]|nr:Dyp-type peroxidase [Terriglobia bacterium]